MLCHHTGDRPLIHHCPDDHLYLVLPEFPCAVFVKGRFLEELGLISLFLGCLKWLCQHLVQIRTLPIDQSMSEIRIHTIPHVVPLSSLSSPEE